MKIILTLFLIFLLLIILNFTFYYRLLEFKIRNSRWWNSLTVEKKKYYLDLKKYQNLVDYFEKVKIGTWGKGMAPFFCDEIIDRRYNPNYDNPLILGKEDSLPFKIKAMTTPVNLLGKKIGESIFRINYENRGRDNQRKELYLQALKPSDLEKYQKRIRTYFKENTNYLNRKQSLFQMCNTICTDLYFILHLGISPNSEDYRDMEIFSQALAYFAFVPYYHPVIQKQVYNLKYFYQRCLKRIKELQKKPRHGIVNQWLEAGMSVDDAFIELIHNILGVVNNWFMTIHPYIILLSEKKIPPWNPTNPDIQPYIWECFRLICPVRFVASSVKVPEMYQSQGKTNHVYDLKTALRMEEFFGKKLEEFHPDRFANYNEEMSQNESNKCPFYRSKKNTLTHCDIPVLEKEGYLPFGSGYRRCPGEKLSMIFLEEVSLWLHNKKIKINLKDGKSKKEKFVLDEIEMNYEILISSL